MNDMKKLISLLIIGTWSACTLLILILIIFNLIDATAGQELLKTFSSVSSGFVGLIVGFYFTGNSN